VTRREFGLVALLLGLTWYAARSEFAHRADWAEWEETRDSVLTEVRAGSAAAASATLRADSAEARAAAAEEVADELGQRIRERVGEIREVEVPAIAAPFVQPRDEIIDDLIIENSALRQANAALRESTVILRTALTASQVSVAALKGVIEDVPGADDWWEPELGAGVFVGLCTGNEVCAGAGLTLTWRVPWG